MMNPYNYYQMKRANFQNLNLEGKPTHHGLGLPRSYGWPCHHLQKGLNSNDSIDIGSGNFLIIIRTEFIGGDKGDSWDRSNHIG